MLTRQPVGVASPQAASGMGHHPHMSNRHRILRLSKSGLPVQWLNREQATTMYAADRVLWTLGDGLEPVYGGVNKCGKRSVIQLAPIIACDGEVKDHGFMPRLSNRLLFRRDHNRCLYCGHQFPDSQLSRDHVLPKVQGGHDCWTNVVAACIRCNHHKGGRTPEQANMSLLAIPFEPNLFEWMYLANREIRGDQMEYLAARFSSKRDWEVAA